MKRLLLLAVLYPAFSASADNWPMWRGPNGDGTCAESNLPEKWSQTENVAWKVSLPDRGNSTPVVWGDKVFVTQAIEKEGKRLLLCFDKTTGKQLWDAGTLYKEQELTHATNPYCSASPASDDERVIVFFASAGVYCYDMNGRELWTCGGLTPLVYNSPLYADGMMIAMGGYGGSAMAVRLGGNGDVTASHRVWHLPRVQQRIGSGVIHDGHHYILTDGGIVECREVKTGQLVYQERLKGPGPTSKNWSSLVLSTDGKCYAANQGGDCFVFKASPTFKPLATNSLGELIIGSIAVSDGQLFIRGYKNLWCIGRK